MTEFPGISKTPESLQMADRLEALTCGIIF
jgi:hypothetical protein